MLDAAELRDRYQRAASYAEYLASAAPHHRRAWNSFHEKAALTDAQSGLIAGFRRRVHAIAVSGVWCGDCAQQLPFLALFEQANPEMFRPRFIDRDEHRDLAERLMICEGLRVPVVLFLNEDFDFISLFGDRSLSRYRALAARQLGAACPLPGAPVDGDEVRATLQDWLDELERVQLLCRLSPKLRARHAD